MSSRSIVLLSAGSATGNWIPWNGGRASLVVIGALATTTKLQTLGQDGATAIDIDTISTAGKTDYDLPAGEYRLYLNGGSPSGVYADILSISYTY